MWGWRGVACWKDPGLGRKSGSLRFALTKKEPENDQWALSVTTGVLASAQDQWIPSPQLGSGADTERP